MTPVRRTPVAAALTTALLLLAACAAAHPRAAAPAPVPASALPGTTAESAGPVGPSATGTPSASSTPSSKPTGRPTPTPTGKPGSAAPVVTHVPVPAVIVPQGPTAPGGSPDGPGGSLSETGTSAVALTFDDGPDPVTTPKLLALLRQYHVHATFCVIGSRARDYPDLIRAIVADGHTLCNHSWQHLTDLAQRPWSYQNWDLQQTTLAIQNAVPGLAVNFMRAPGGNFTPALCKLIGEQHMKPLYWDVDPRDWDNPTYGTGPGMVNHIITTVEAQVHAGSVILSHDRSQHPDTITAYQTLLPWLLARYQLVPLY